LAAPVTRTTYPPLLPVGFHSTDIAGLQRLCVDYFPRSRSRPKLMNTVSMVVSLVNRVSIPSRLWVGDAFVTEEDEPERCTLTLVLVDAMERRCRFLERATEQLGLATRVSVECGRAEELARREDLRGRFPVVVTRSFGPPAVTAECGVGFLASGGRLLVSEPPVRDPGRWPSAGLAQLGLELGELMEGSSGAVQVVRFTGALEDRFPRRVGIPAKRPMF